MANHNQMGIDTSRRNLVPRPLTDSERAKLDEFIDSIHYSARCVLQPHASYDFCLLTHEPRYSDSEYEYRHVQLPKPMLKAIPEQFHDKTTGTLKLLWEEEWRAMGITQVSWAYTRHRRSPQWQRLTF